MHTSVEAITNTGKLKHLQSNNFSFVANENLFPYQQVFIKLILCLKKTPRKKIMKTKHLQRDIIGRDVSWLNSVEDKTITHLEECLEMVIVLIA